jgi:hypothetical protein
MGFVMRRSLPSLGLLLALLLRVGVSVVVFAGAPVTVPHDQVMVARSRFAEEVAMTLAPWTVFVLLGAFGYFTGSPFSIGLALVVTGGLLFLKQNVKYPMTFSPASEVAVLLGRLDASPVRGIGVEVRGQIIGRDSPGYMLSPDLVVQDRSGFVPLKYRQPIPVRRRVLRPLRGRGLHGTGRGGPRVVSPSPWPWRGTAGGGGGRRPKRPLSALDRLLRHLRRHRPGRRHHHGDRLGGVISVPARIRWARSRSPAFTQGACPPRRWGLR